MVLGIPDIWFASRLGGLLKCIVLLLLEEVFLLFERQSDKAFQSLVHSSDCCSGHTSRPGQLRVKLGAWNCVSHLGGRVPSAWAVFGYFPRHIKCGELDWKQQLGLELEIWCEMLVLQVAAFSCYGPQGQSRSPSSYLIFFV